MKRILSSKRYHYLIRLSIFLVIGALIAGIVGCAAGPREYTLTVSSTGGGEVTSPGEGSFIYYEGEVASLIAVAESGYRFANWAGDVSTIADPNAAATTITMNDDYSIMANFYEIPMTYYTLTLAVNGNGSTSPSAGQHTYAAGTVVSITAAPAAGYRFVNWTGSVGTVAIAATITVTMNADYSIMANFEEGADFPDPNFGATIGLTWNNTTGTTNPLPSDVQGHTPFR
jgi:hypothetical protein